MNRQARSTAPRKTPPRPAAGLLLAALVLLAAATAAVTLLPRPVAAGCNCSCAAREHDGTRNFMEDQHNQTRRHMTAEMTYHQRWFFTEFFDEYILPAEMMMAEQLTAVGMQQMHIVGAFLDAKHQLESQRLFQQLTARAHKDYHSSTGMCTIATGVRGLSASDRRAEATSFILARRSMDRQLGSREVAATEGPTYDRASRIAQFLRRYCDLNDANRSLRVWCESSAPSQTINKDLDYNRLIETPLTLNIDYTDGAFEQNSMESDEEDVMALASNLFSHSVFQRLAQTDVAILANQQLYLDLRSVVAKRSVAENSFYTIVGMKARGSAESETAAGYVGVVLQQLGVPDDEIFRILGDRPSYFALMNVLSQKLYQRPEFYTDLYDKPANVARKDVSMRAIDLMLDRDIYKSELRTEAMLAVLLELELSRLHNRVRNLLPDVGDGMRVIP